MSKFSDFYAKLQALIPEAEAAFAEAAPLVAGIAEAADPALTGPITIAENAVAIAEKAVPEVTGAINAATYLVSGLQAVIKGETPAEWSAFIAQKKIDDAAVLAIPDPAP